jgi:hypothetical protein
VRASRLQVPCSGAQPICTVHSNQKRTSSSVFLIAVNVIEYALIDVGCIDHGQGSVVAPVYSALGAEMLQVINSGVSYNGYVSISGKLLKCLCGAVVECY